MKIVVPRRRFPRDVDAPFRAALSAARDVRNYASGADRAAAEAEADPRFSAEQAKRHRREAAEHRKTAAEAEAEAIGWASL